MTREFRLLFTWIKKYGTIWKSFAQDFSFSTNSKNENFRSCKTQTNFSTRSRLTQKVLRQFMHFTWILAPQCSDAFSNCSLSPDNCTYSHSQTHSAAFGAFKISSPTRPNSIAHILELDSRLSFFSLQPRQCAFARSRLSDTRRSSPTFEIVRYRHTNQQIEGKFICLLIRVFDFHSHRIACAYCSQLLLFLRLFNKSS